MQNRNKSDADSTDRFVCLLEQRGCQFWDEDHLDEVLTVRGKRPDFYVRTKEKLDFLVEVESFARESFSRRALRQNQVMFGLAERDWRQIRHAAKRAANQLRPYQSLKIPMLIVLDDLTMGIPKNVAHLRFALLGHPELHLQINTQGRSVGSQALHHGSGQFFNEREKRYVSAVAWNLQTHLRIVHNPWAIVRLPTGTFTKSVDEHWGYNDEGDWVKFEINAANRG